MPCGAFSPLSTGTVLFRAPGVFRIRKRQHRAVARVSHQQHAARTEGHLARIRRVRENRNMEARRQLQPRSSRVSATWLQDSSNKGNRAANPALGQGTTRIRIVQSSQIALWMVPGDAAAVVPDYRNKLHFLQPLAHEVFISDFAKITRQQAFFRSRLEANGVTMYCWETT